MANLSNYNFVSGNTATFTGNIAGNYFIGNGSQLTGVPTIADLEAFLPTYNGNLNNVDTVIAIHLDGEGGNIGNIQGANVTGEVANAAFATVSASSNSVDGANVSGTVANATFAITSGSADSVAGANVTGEVANAAFATVSASSNSVDGANVVGEVANANYAAFSGQVVDSAQSNITSVGSLTSLEVLGITDLVDLNASGAVVLNGVTITEQQLTTTGAGFEITGTDQGVQLQSLDTANSTFTLVFADNTGAGLVTNEGEIIVGLDGNVTVTDSMSVGGDLSTAGNVTADYFIGNGSQLTDLPVAATIANGTSNVSIAAADGPILMFDGGDRVASISTERVAIGDNAGITDQNIFTVAVGYESGNDTQGIRAVAIGFQSGANSQGANAIAIGATAAASGQGDNSIAIGSGAGNDTQGTVAIAIGLNSGVTTQGGAAVAIGGGAGFNAQGSSAVAIGADSANDTQGENAIAIGSYAGSSAQGTSAIAIGLNTGGTSQGVGAVAIGQNAGQANQGASSIAIGASAGETDQPVNSIIINASGSTLDGIESGLYINPVRNDTGNTTNVVYYNDTTKEVTYGPGATPYGNTEVAAYLPTYTGNLDNVSSVGNATTVLFGDGANITGLPAQYGNAEVSAYLASGSDTAGFLTFGDIQSTTGNGSFGGNVDALAFSGDGAQLTNITGAEVTGEVAFAATANSVAGSNVVGSVFSATRAAQANSVSGSNVVGEVGNATYAQIVTSSQQPNITAVGTLTDLTVNSSNTISITGANSTSVTLDSLSNLVSINQVANIDVGGNITTLGDITTTGNILATVVGNATTYLYGDGSNITGIAGGYSNADVANYLPTYTGNLGNVNSLGTTGNIDTLGDINASLGNITAGGNVSATGFSGNGAALSNIAGANVTGQVANALVSATVYDNAQPNITSVGTLTSLEVTGISLFGDANIGNLVVRGTTTTANVSDLDVANATIVIASGANAIVANGAGLFVGSEVATVGSLTFLDASNSWNSSLLFQAPDFATTGNVTGAHIIGEGGNLSNITAANLVGSVPSATVADSANSVAGANVTGAVANATFATTAGTADSVAGANVTGEVAFAAVANSVDGGNVVGGVFQAFQATRASIANSVSGANVSGTVGNATYAQIVTSGNQPNITQLGTLIDLTVTGNVTGDYFIGNGSQLTGLPSGYSNSDVSTYLASGTDTAGIVTTGNISSNNISVSASANLGDVANITITGGTAGQTLSTDGAGNLSWTSYGDANIAAYLSGGTDTTGFLTSGDVVANNLVADGGLSSFGEAQYYANVTINADANVTGNLLATAIVAATIGNASSVLFGDGANIAGLPAPYTDTDVSLYLASGIDSDGYTTTGNVTTTADVSANNLSVTANIASGNNITAVGNISANGNIIVNGTIGTGNISGANNISGLTVLASNAILVGSTVTTLPNTVARFGSNANSYTQITFQNLSTGTDATSDIVLTTDNGNDTVNFADFGIINSAYDPNTPTNSLGNVVFASDAYLYAQGNTGNTAQSGGNLVLGATVSTKNVKIFAGGNTNAFVTATFTSTAANLKALNVAGTSNLGPVANVTITGGTAGQVLTTNGSNVLSWTTVSGGGGGASIANGTSNVNIATSGGNITMAVAGTRVATISGTSILLGNNAGGGTIGANSIVIGPDTAAAGTGANAIVIGSQVGAFYQLNGIAIGDIITARGGQGANAIAIGSGSAGGGVLSGGQGARAVALGYQAGGGNQPLDGGQGANAVAIGANAGYAGQAANSIVINATGAALTTAAAGFVVAPVRNDTGNVTNVVYYNTTTKEVTYGPASPGSIITNGTSNVRIAAADGNISFNINGTSAGFITDEFPLKSSIALGMGAGTVGNGTIAIGYSAGSLNQGFTSIAIGPEAGRDNQGVTSIAIGTQAGLSTQGDQGIAIGVLAGSSGQGVNAIAIGRGAGKTDQSANSIIINATGADLDGSNSGLYVAPVRNDTGNVTNAVYYNTTTKEVTYGPGSPTYLSKNTLTGNTTMTLAQGGSFLYSTSATAQTLTIPTNASVAFPVGTTINVVLQGAGSIELIPTSGVSLYLGGNATSATRTISPYGIATLLQVATDTWFINGTGVY